MSGDKNPSIRNGRRVLFVGGPEAGNARLVPESHGDLVQGDGDWLYRIHGFRSPSGDTLFLGYEEGQHVLNAIVDMFREYAPAAQIKAQTGISTYNRPTPKTAQ